MLARIGRALHNPQQIRDAISRRLSPDAFKSPSLGPCSDDPHRFVGMVPDRYASRLEKYLERGGVDCAETKSKFLAVERNDGDLTRYYFLRLVCDQLLKENIVGDVAELGVWKGSTAAVLVEFARRIDSMAYLLDTFDGFDTADLVGIDADKMMEFADTSTLAVTELIGARSVRFIKGHFPATQGKIPADARFAMVHIDCDLYIPFRAALEFFYPKIVKGGFLLMHDYASLWWDGVEKATDEFFADKPETVIPIPDKSGTAVIRKMS
jgi:O-methyltransferase